MFPFPANTVSAQLEKPLRFAIDSDMPKFWPPRPSRFWSLLIRPLESHLARRIWQVRDVTIDGLAEAVSPIEPGDGVLIAPNHSFEGDAYVLRTCARRLRRQFYFMADWRAFRRNKGLNGWLMQRLGVFSVDRDGSDRRAVRQAIELLTAGQWLVVFPEGEIHHLNERLTPLLDGVSFMALSAQRQLIQDKKRARIWMLPAAIRYRPADGDVAASLAPAMTRLERRMFWSQPPRDATLRQRIVRFGELLLTLKEKEKLGRSCEALGDLPARIANLIEALLCRHEQHYLNKTPSGKTVALRVKALRRHLSEVGADVQTPAAAREQARAALDDIQMALQLYSYPGNYIRDDQAVMPMVETVEKFVEDVYGATRPLVPRMARICFGQPINLGDNSSSRLRTAVAESTERLETSLEELLVRAG